MDEESVLDFLTSLEAMDLPDRIEEVNQKILSKIIEDTDYVAVLFCKYWSVLLPRFCSPWVNQTAIVIIRGILLN